MGDIRSELSWSFSRDKIFNECKRAYYYYYYASWGGWEDGAPEFAKKARDSKTATSSHEGWS